MTQSRLLVIGSGSALIQALAVARARGCNELDVCELEAKDIANFDPGLLAMKADQSEVFAAIGTSALNFARYDLWAKLRYAGYRFATLVHPTASVEVSATMGEAVLVGAGATLDAGAQVLLGSVIGAGSVLGVEAVVDAWCWLAPGSKVGSSAYVGPHTVLGVGSRLGDGAKVMGYSEFDCPDILRGTHAEGTFITPEFAAPGARMMAGGGI